MSKRGPSTKCSIEGCNNQTEYVCYYTLDINHPYGACCSKDLEACGRPVCIDHRTLWDTYITKNLEKKYKLFRRKLDYSNGCIVYPNLGMVVDPYGNFRHIGNPFDPKFHEMICSECMPKKLQVSKRNCQVVCGAVLFWFSLCIFIPVIVVCSILLGHSRSKTSD